MVFEIAENAPKRTHSEVQQLHELAVNKFGYDTTHVLFTAHSDGTISGRIAFNTSRSSDDTDNDREHTTLYNRIARHFQNNDDDTDPDPPVVCAPVTPDVLDASTSDEAEANV